MREAFEHVTYKTKVQAKYNQNLTEEQLYAGRAVDRDWYLDMIGAMRRPEMAKGYRLRMERHTQEFNQAVDVGYCTVKRNPTP